MVCVRRGENDFHFVRSHAKRSFVNESGIIGAKERRNISGINFFHEDLETSIPWNIFVIVGTIELHISDVSATHRIEFISRIHKFVLKIVVSPQSPNRNIRTGTRAVIYGEFTAANRHDAKLHIGTVAAHNHTSTVWTQVVWIWIVVVTVIAKTRISGRRVVEITRRPTTCVVVKGNHQVARAIVCKRSVEHQCHPTVNGSWFQCPCENDVRRRNFFVVRRTFKRVFVHVFHKYNHRTVQLVCPIKMETYTGYHARSTNFISGVNHLREGVVVERIDRELIRCTGALTNLNNISTSVAAEVSHIVSVFCHGETISGICGYWHTIFSPLCEAITRVSRGRQRANLAISKAPSATHRTSLRWISWGSDVVISWRCAIAIHIKFIRETTIEVGTWANDISTFIAYREGTFLCPTASNPSQNDMASVYYVTGHCDCCTVL